jgi:penicillin-binding protein 1A
MLKKHRWLKKTLKIAVIGFLTSILLAVGFYYSVSFGFFGKLYTEKELKAFENELATQVLSADKVLIGKFFDKNRTNVKYHQIPKHLVNALVATEDARYFEHEGVDKRSLVRVLVKSILLSDKRAGGGSTITQQLSKNMYGRKNHGALSMPVNKCKEVILANRLERVYDKEEILTLYLNTVPFGENVYGIDAAANRFFNKSVTDLSIQEGAVLIGMLKANTHYNPRLHPDNALTRRNTVLNQMFKYDYIQQATLDSLKTLPIELDYANLDSEGPANYFLVQVKKEAESILDLVNEENDTEYDIEKDGLVITTTLNYTLQTSANKAFKKHLSSMQDVLRSQYKYGDSKKELSLMANQLLNQIGGKNEVKKRLLFDWDGYQADSISALDSIKQSLTLLHGGIFGLNPNNGKILAWVGGIDFKMQPYDQINAKRQLASTFKPLLYATAIENGREPCDYIDNSAFSLTDFDGWAPENYDHSEGGKYSLAAALANSKNIPTVRLYFETGFDKVNYLWKKFKFSSVLEDKPSLSLGTAEASMFELARAYASFANGGKIVQPYSVQMIKNRDGEILYERKAKEEYEQIMEERTALLMNEILKKAVREGTGTAIRNIYDVRFQLAGKTGTSQGYSDAWFVGYNPGILMVSRVGANSPSIHFNSGANGSGSRLALPLVAMTLANAQQNTKFFNQYNKRFNSLPDKYRNALNCEDFLENNRVEKFFQFFQKKETTFDKAKKREKRKRLNPLRKIFGD